MENNRRSLGVLLDCSRDAVYSVPALKTFIGLIAGMGYTSLQLYTEDTYTLENEPYFGRFRGRYSRAELQELDAFAASEGVELVPCIQTLAHLGGALRWPAYAGRTDVNDILLAGDERTYALIDKMFASCAASYTSRRINIGMDEAHLVGLGRYLGLHGYRDRFSILSEHLHRVTDIARKYGFSPMMWSDMFFRLACGGEYYGGSVPPAVAGQVPEGLTLVYWDYYSTDRAHYERMLDAYAGFSNPVAFAGGAWSWSGFVPHNRFSIAASRAALSACRSRGVEDVFITCWRDDGAECSLYAPLPALYCAAAFYRGETDEDRIARGFAALTGLAMDEFLAADLPEAGEEGVADPCKYMLYSDPFLGLFDDTVNGPRARSFAPAEARLRAAAARSALFAPMFENLADLCSLMQVKYDLGARTRRAYRAGDPATLRALDADYAAAETRLGRFLQSFRARWESECKPYGLEKHDVRLGGLLCRLGRCRAVLREYCSGARASIPELEEEPLPYDPAAERGKDICFNDWFHTAFIKPQM